MHIAFYAPLKPPDHPVPSGDRHMARALIRALELAGHRVSLVSSLRSHLRDPDPTAIDALQAAANRERQRLDAAWIRDGAPALFFCYHPYYRSPDLIGPELCRQRGIPYVTAEASYAAKRDATAWAPLQATVVEGVRQAVLNLCYTERDADGLRELVPSHRIATLPPFIDMPADLPRASGSTSGRRLVTVAMMRQSNKRDSYLMLARVLTRILHLDWRLDIVGDGAARGQIEAAFSGFPPERIHWHRDVAPADVPALMASADIFVWPGCNEAYGLVYLEAQAVGLPVVGQRAGGVPAVVHHGVGGLLTPEDDEVALAEAIAGLLTDPTERRRLADGAYRFAHGERTLAVASRRLNALLNTALEPAA